MFSNCPMNRGVTPYKRYSNANYGKYENANYGDFGRSLRKSIRKVTQAVVKAPLKVVQAVAKPVVSVVSKVASPVLKPLTKIPILGKGIAAVGGATGLLKMKPVVIEEAGGPTTVYQDEAGNYITEMEYNRLMTEYGKQEAAAVAAEAAARTVTPMAVPQVVPGVPPAGVVPVPTILPETRMLPTITPASFWQAVRRRRPERGPTPEVPTPAPLELVPKTVVDQKPSELPVSPGPVAATMQQAAQPSFLQAAVNLREQSMAEQQAQQDQLPGVYESVDPELYDIFSTRSHLTNIPEDIQFGEIKRKRRINMRTRGPMVAKKRTTAVPISGPLAAVKRNFRRRMGVSGFGAGITFESGPKPLQYGPLTLQFAGFGQEGEWQGPVQPASTTSWLDTISELAKKGAGAVTAARGLIQSTRGKTTTVKPPLAIAPIPAAPTIAGVPRTAVYIGTGLLLAGGIAYFAFRKK